MARKTALTAFPFVIVAIAAVLLIVPTMNRSPAIAADEMGAFGFEPGELVADFDYRDVEGNKGTLDALLEGNEALVIVMRTAECPVSRRYGHRLAELEEAYSDKGVQFVYLNISEQDTEEDVAEDVERFGFTSPYILDPGREIGSLLQANVSSEVFVIDRAKTLRYRGAVDDQHGITFSNPEVHDHYLQNALDDVLAGVDVTTPFSEASGCYLEGEVATVPQRGITYHSRISRIVNQNCVTCHREGGVGPFALDSYEQVHGFRHMVHFMVTADLMPPWFAAPEHGEWENDRRLSDRDKRDLISWIEDGAPEGDVEVAALPRKLKPGWMLGTEPDTIITIPAPQQVPPDGVLDYRHVYVDTNWPEDKWVMAAEVVPTAPQVTHHVIVYLEDEEAEQRGGWLIGYAPGVPVRHWGETAGKRIPPGQTLMFELHYTTNGEPAVDETMVGLWFHDEPPADEVYMAAVATDEFEIPAHAANHEVVAELEFENAGRIISLLPHMHLRGKAFRYDLIRADGTEKTILEVPNYDFNWQLTYKPIEPFVIEPGDKLRGTAWYDNSEGNPANPDPSQSVRYGEQSFEEMMFGFFELIPGRGDAGETSQQDQ
ncbi:MAG: redoxin family protein [Gemmatimonadota bacterium]|nr:redoxin family protein [Gemmatimonadota bacterium]